MFMSLTVHLTSQAPNRQHLPGPSVLFNGSLSLNEHLIHDILPFAEARYLEPFQTASLWARKAPRTHLGGHDSAWTASPLVWECFWQGKHCKGVTDLPVRCSSSQSPWPPPPCPPSWGVSPFICRFSPPEYMFFLGKNTACQSTKKNPEEPG